MTLRRKALLIVAVTLISLIGILYTVSRFVFIEGLSEIEELDVHKQVEQAAGVLSNELANLEANTANWSAWDNTYVFIESGDEEYIQSNLTDETFINLQLNLMLFIHSSGQVVFSKVFI
jgi:sensor domain CHASE-containing protein